MPGTVLIPLYTYNSLNSHKSIPIIILHSEEKIGDYKSYAICQSSQRRKSELRIYLGYIQYLTPKSMVLTTGLKYIDHN